MQFSVLFVFVLNTIGLGLRGITIVFAAGDSGADCNSNGNQFAPDWVHINTFDCIYLLIINEISNRFIV